MKYYIWIQVALAFVCYSGIEASTECFECQNLQVPSDCTNVVTCHAGQVCYLEKVSTISGQVYYKSGCRNHTKCSGAPSPVGKRSVISKRSTLWCSECCVGSYCNAFGCDSLEKECMRRMNRGYFYDSTSDTCSNVVKSAIGQTFNQSEAAESCHSHGASMATISSQAEQHFLLSWIYTHYRNTTDYWIGLKVATPGSHHYYWSSGQALTYDNWGSTMKSQPTGGTNDTENCVYMKSSDNFNWYDEGCDRPKMGFICEIITENTSADCIRNVYKGYYYDSTSGTCVHLVDDAKAIYTYHMAVERCQKDNAKLVKVDSAVKMDFLYRWIVSNGGSTTDFWIGAKDRQDTNTFTWPDGSRVQYASWGGPEFPARPHNQPDELFSHRYDQRCVYLTGGMKGEWYDERCSASKRGFICQYKGSTEIQTESGCYSRLGDGFFFDYRTKLCVAVFTSGSSSVNRDKAQSECGRFNGSLVEIETRSESQFIVNLIYSLRKNGTDFWIGGEDLNQNGTFYWEHPARPFTFTNWHKAPHLATEDCVVLDHTDTFHWYPEQCGARKQGYICELDNTSVIQHALTNYLKATTTTTTTTTTATTTPTTATTTTSTTTPTTTATTTERTTTTATTTSTSTTTTAATTPSTTSTTTTTTTPTTKTTTTTRPTTETTTPGRTVSPDGYQDISNRSLTSVCIKLYTSRLSYQQARHTCHNDGAALVYPSTAAMMTDIQNYMDAFYRGISSFYLGLYSQHGNGVFTSGAGDHVVYTNWMNGEPTHNDECVRANEVSGYQWQAIKCSYPIPFMCQKRRGC